VSRIAVVVPAYDAGEHLLPAVRSVLDQTWRDLRVLVMDDGGTDGSVDALARLDDPRLEVHRLEHGGRAAALNAGLDRCRTSGAEIMVIQDADDLARPGRVQALVRALDDDPALAACLSGHALLVDGRRFAPIERELDPEAVRASIERFRMPAHDPTAAFRVTALDRCRWAEDLPIAAGLDHLLRLGERAPLRVLGRALYDYRLHHRQVTGSNLAGRIPWVLEVVDRAARRRGLDERATRALRADFARDLARVVHPGSRIGVHAIAAVQASRARGDVAGAVRTAAGGLGRRPLDPFSWRAALHAVRPGRRAA